MEKEKLFLVDFEFLIDTLTDVEDELCRNDDFESMLKLLINLPPLSVSLCLLPSLPPARLEHSLFALFLGDKLAVWTGDARNAEHNMKIGRTLKSRLEIPKSISIGFQAHTDTISKSGSTTKNRYTV